MAKKKSKTEETAPRALVDFGLELPEDSKELVEGGKLLLYFDADTAKNVYEIASEFVRSRRLPVDLDDVKIDDPLVLWMIDARKEELAADDGTTAILEVRHMYEERIKQCNADAIIVSMTAYTNIKKEFDDNGKHVDPKPYKTGQAPFTEEQKRPKSPFMAAVEERQKDVPDVMRNMKNPYEMRLKWLDDTISTIGFEFYLKATRAMNKAVIDIINFGGLEEKDEAGFQPESTG